MRQVGKAVCSIAIAIVVVATSLLLASCGAEDSADPPRTVAEVVQRLQADFESGDVAGVCGLMTRPAQVQAGNVAHRDPTECVSDVRRVFKLIRDGGGWLGGKKPRVASVRARGETAWATLEAGGWRAEVPFLREGGQWRLDGFFGVSPRQLDRVAARLSRQPFPKAGGPVQATEVTGTTCGPTSDDQYPEISGGCRLRVSTRLAGVEMLTPFGGFKFGDCSVTYRVIVDGDGRTWTDEWHVDGTPESGCADIAVCTLDLDEAKAGFDHLPWKGRLRAGPNGFTHHMDMCLRTCIGMFTGEFVMRLERDGKGWRARPDDGGATGFRFADSLRVSGEELRLSAARRSEG